MKLSVNYSFLTLFSICFSCFFPKHTIYYLYFFFIFSFFLLILKLFFFLVQFLMKFFKSISSFLKKNNRKTLFLKHPESLVLQFSLHGNNQWNHHYHPGQRLCHNNSHVSKVAAQGKSGNDFSCHFNSTGKNRSLSVSQPLEALPDPRQIHR